MTLIATQNMPTPEVTAALKRHLHPAFIWGAATSAAQIEGAAFEDGRGASIWDTFARRPGAIKDASNLDTACDHYHRWADDVALMKALGLQAYRFSMSWSRVQPLGRGAWNEAGFAYYERLVDGLLAAGIQPHLTLFHWDLPQALDDDFGGLLHRDVVQHFADYAAEVGRRLGDRLVSIATLNEPLCSATLGYETGQFAPGRRHRGEAKQVAHHLLLMHGQAIQALRAQTGAQLGLVLNHTPSFPAEEREADRRAARLEDGLDVRWYMDPVFRGHYPPDIVEYLGADAPSVLPGDMACIHQPLDFLGINFYTRRYVSTQVPALQTPGQQGFTDMGWEIFPNALAQHLVRIQREYCPPPMYITENGMANADQLEGERVPDAARIRYLAAHLQAVAQAVELGADVRAYFYWSLMDNFEWDSGYTKRFGLVHVDYATQQRRLKDSARWYRDFIAAQPG